jgi:hypothetical protein
MPSPLTDNQTDKLLDMLQTLKENSDYRPIRRAAGSLFKLINEQRYKD